MKLPGPFLEAINGVLVILFFWVGAWFAYDIWMVRITTGSWRATHREAAASIACLVAFSGDIIIRSSVWWYRHLENDGHPTEDLLQIATLTITAGVVVMIFGCACIINYLSPPALGRAPWAIAIISALMIGIGLAL